MFFARRNAKNEKRNTKTGGEKREVIGREAREKAEKDEKRWRVDEKRENTS